MVENVSHSNRYWHAALAVAMTLLVVSLVIFAMVMVDRFSGGEKTPTNNPADVATAELGVQP